MIRPSHDGLLTIRRKAERGQWLQTVALDPATGTFAVPDLDDHGGRFNPPGRYPMMYFARNDAESRDHIERWIVLNERRDLRLVSLVLEVHLWKVLDLCDPDVRVAVGVTLGDLEDAEDMSVTRSLGVAAFREQFDGIIYPRPLSLSSKNLGVFRERVTAQEIVVVGAAGLTP